MKTLTVITTTYNRDYCLHQVYDSLKRQTSSDFLWMIIDDGSTDNTKELVQKWIDEKLIEIEYYYKTNGGMHTARNLAYEKCTTELNVIIDSDDWMTDDAVEKIVRFWKANGSNDYCGIISDNVDKNGNMIGSPLPNIKSCRRFLLSSKYHVKGDKKLILRSELTRLYPYPEFEGEKFFPASYKFRLIDQQYDILVMHEYTCVVDYNSDSMTYNKYAQYKTCAKGFAFFRNEMIKLTNSPKEIIREMIHYIAESKMANSKHVISGSAKPFYTIICFPIGLLYLFYLNNTKKRY